jgi:O-antigen/teichoic acid export membrane protein
MYSRIAALLSGSAGATLLIFGTQFLLARFLTVGDYGKLAAALAVINLLQIFSGYGIGWLWLELFGREGQGAFRWVDATLRVMMITSSAAITLLALYVYFADPKVAIFPIIIFWTAVLVGQVLAETTSARLQLEERYIGLASWQLLTPFGRFVAVGIMVFSQIPYLTQVAAAYAIVALLVSAISVSSVKQVRYQHISLAGHDDQSVSIAPGGDVTVGRIFIDAAPYCFSTFFYLFYAQGVVVITERLGGVIAAAHYNAAYLVVAAIYLVPSVIYTKYLMGKLFRWWTYDRERFAAVISSGVVVGAVIGITCMLCLLTAAPLIIRCLFGSEYLAAVPVLQLLAIGVPIRFVQHAYGAAFFSKENMKRKVRYIGVAGLCCVVWGMLLIPTKGALGAAAAAVISEFTLLVLYMWGVARHVEAVDVKPNFSLGAALAAFQSPDGPESTGGGKWVLARYEPRSQATERYAGGKK